jgi:hypothetical protein
MLSTKRRIWLVILLHSLGVLAVALSFLILNTEVRSVWGDSWRCSERTPHYAFVRVKRLGAPNWYTFQDISYWDDRDAEVCIGPIDVDLPASYIHPKQFVQAASWCLGLAVIAYGLVAVVMRPGDPLPRRRLWGYVLPIGVMVAITIIRRAIEYYSDAFELTALHVMLAAIIGGAAILRHYRHAALMACLAVLVPKVVSDFIWVGLGGEQTLAQFLLWTGIFIGVLVCFALIATLFFRFDRAGRALRIVWWVGAGLFLLLYAWLTTLLGSGTISARQDPSMWFLVGMGIAWALGGVRCKPISKWGMVLFCVVIAGFALAMLILPR